MINKIRLEELSKNEILAFGEKLEILTPLKPITQKLGKKLILVCLSDSVENIKNLEEIKKSIADEVWLILHPELYFFRDDLYANVLIELIKITQPLGFFFPANSIGTSLAPRIAGTLNLGLCAHVNHLELKNNEIIMARPTFGENIIAQLKSTTHPIMATISLGAFSIKKSEKEPKFEEVIFPEDFSWKSSINLKKFKPSKKKRPKLSSAKIVVAGGRGLKNKNNFQKLFELAEILGAEVGGTRPVCYEGWIEEERMIGISGVTVRPKIYIGFGISGAIQHTEGMKDSEFIIAINTDKNAPFVKMANLALIGDAETILKILIEKLKTS